MRCSWHYNVIFFVVTLSISPGSIFIQHGSAEVLLIYSFWEMILWLKLKVNHFCVVVLFPTHFSANKLVKTSNCCLSGLELYAAAYKIKNIKTVFQKHKKFQLQQNPANQNYGPWNIQFRTQQHKFLVRLQIEINRRKRPVQVSGYSSWLQTWQLTNIKHSPLCVIKVQKKMAFISKRKATRKVS